MLSREDNELYTRVGPGTPMGELFRRFWLPALLVERAARTRRRAGARAAARRGPHRLPRHQRQGRLLERTLPAPRASLFFGRNEEGGLRCVYHGWKFDTRPAAASTCRTSRPTAASRTRSGCAATRPARPADVVWVYMGPSDLHPELPQFEWMHVPPDQRMVTRWHRIATGPRAWRARSTPATCRSCTGCSPGPRAPTPHPG